MHRLRRISEGHRRAGTFEDAKRSTEITGNDKAEFVTRNSSVYEEQTKRTTAWGERGGHNSANCRSGTSCNRAFYPIRARRSVVDPANVRNGSFASVARLRHVRLSPNCSHLVSSRQLRDVSNADVSARYSLCSKRIQRLPLSRSSEYQAPSRPYEARRDARAGCSRAGTACRIDFVAARLFSSELAVSTLALL